MQRPLSEELLEYAASDIHRIAKLYDHFVEHGYLKRREQLREISSNYVRMHRDTGKPDSETIYRRGPFLPLTISLEIKGKRAQESSKECFGCRRMIPERHFPLATPGKNKGEKKNEKKDAPRTEMCKLCTLIDAKVKFAEKRKAEKAKKAEAIVEQLRL